MSVRKLSESAYFVVDEASFTSTIMHYDPLVANQSISNDQELGSIVPLEPLEVIEQPLTTAEPPAALENPIGPTDNPSS